MGHGPLPHRQLDERRLDGVRREERQVAEKATRAATSRRGCPGKSAAGDETPPETLNLAGAAKEIKGTRFALAKGRESLTDSQRPSSTG